MTAPDIFDFASYKEAFNAGDDDLLVDEFFAEDVFFAGSSMTLHGRDEVREFLRRTHDGILETMRPQHVLVTSGRVAAQIDMDFQATKDVPQFVFGPLEMGQSVTVKFFVFYEICDRKIAALRGSVWAPGRGVTERPTTITADSTGKRAFLDYTAAFSNGDIDRFTDFYTENVELVLPSATIRGKSAVSDFYKKMFATVVERLTPHDIVVDSTGLKVGLTSRFTALEDVPDLSIGPLSAGESYEGRYLIDYRLISGKIEKIQAVRQEPLRGPFRAS